MTISEVRARLAEISAEADQCQHARAHAAEKRLWLEVLASIAGDGSLPAPARQLAQDALLSQEIDFRRTFG